MRITFDKDGESFYGKAFYVRTEDPFNTLNTLAILLKDFPKADGYEPMDVIYAFARDYGIKVNLPRVVMLKPELVKPEAAKDYFWNTVSQPEPVVEPEPAAKPKLTAKPSCLETVLAHFQPNLHFSRDQLMAWLEEHGWCRASYGSTAAQLKELALVVKHGTNDYEFVGVKEPPKTITEAVHRYLAVYPNAGAPALAKAIKRWGLKDNPSLNNINNIKYAWRSTMRMLHEQGESALERMATKR